MGNWLDLQSAGKKFGTLYNNNIIIYATESFTCILFYIVSIFPEWTGSWLINFEAIWSNYSVYKALALQSCLQSFSF